MFKKIKYSGLPLLLVTLFSCGTSSQPPVSNLMIGEKVAQAYKNMAQDPINSFIIDLSTSVDLTVAQERTEVGTVINESSSVNLDVEAAASLNFKAFGLTTPEQAQMSLEAGLSKLNVSSNFDGNIESVNISSPESVKAYFKDSRIFLNLANASHLVEYLEDASGVQLPSTKISSPEMPLSDDEDALLALPALTMENTDFAELARSYLDKIPSFTGKQVGDTLELKFTLTQTQLHDYIRSLGTEFLLAQSGRTLDDLTANELAQLNAMLDDLIEQVDSVLTIRKVSLIVKIDTKRNLLTNIDVDIDVSISVVNEGEYEAYYEDNEGQYHPDLVNYTETVDVTAKFELHFALTKLNENFAIDYPNDLSSYVLFAE